MRDGGQGERPPTAMMAWPRKARPALSSHGLPISPLVNSDVPDWFSKIMMTIGIEDWSERAWGKRPEYSGET